MIRNDKLRFSAVALALFLVPVVGAGFFAPYDPTSQNRDSPLAPPTSIHFYDSRGRFHFRPFVCSLADTARLGSQQYREDCSKTSPLRFFVRSERVYDGRVLNAYRHLFGSDAPGHVFLFRDRRLRTGPILAPALWRPDFAGGRVAGDWALLPDWV